MHGLDFTVVKYVLTAAVRACEGEDGQLNDLANQVAVWPSGDLFPSNGIPAF